MVKGKVKLSHQGQDYLNNPRCSTIVRTILRSIESHSAEVLDVQGSIVRVRLLDDELPEEIADFNNFAIHRDHVSIS